MAMPTARAASLRPQPCGASQSGIAIAKEYRGWSVAWDYGACSATGPNYDASWEGEEDGWVDNGERVSARTLPDLYIEVDAYFEEHADAQG